MGSVCRCTLPGSMNTNALVPALITIVFWSSAFAGIKVGLAGYSPLHLTILRFGVASLAFLVYAPLARIPLPRLKDVPKLFVLGLFGITLYHTLLNIGEQSVSAGVASLIIAIAPVFTAILSHSVLGERISRWGWCGMAISFSGIGLMVANGGALEFTQGALLILISSLCTAVFFVFQKPLLSTYRPIHLTAYVTWLGFLPLLIFAGGFGTALTTAPLSATLAGIYIGIFPAAIAYASWSMALAKLPPGQATSFLYLTPPLAMTFGLLWVHETPQVTEIAGGMVALLGVIIVNRLGYANRNNTVPAAQNRNSTIQTSATRETTK